MTEITWPPLSPGISYEKNDEGSLYKWTAHSTRSNPNANRTIVAKENPNMMHAGVKVS